MLPSINTMHLCSQEQAHIYIQFNLKKASLAVWAKESHRATKSSSRNTGQAAPVSWRVKIWRRRIGTNHTQKKKRCVVLWGIFKSITPIEDNHTFWLQEIPPLCFSASNAWEVLSCLPGTCIGCRESWKVAVPNGAASLDPFCSSQNPWGNGDKEEQSSVPLQTCN